MSRIEIRLDPSATEPILTVLGPVLQRLGQELAVDPRLPGDDPDLESFWQDDLLESQREEVAVLAAIFDAEFRETGRASIAPEMHEQLMRACSAARLELRRTALAAVPDEQLETDDLEAVAWTPALRMGYFVYSLLGHMQELAIAHMEGRFDMGDVDWEDDDDGRLN